MNKFKEVANAILSNLTGYQLSKVDVFISRRDFIKQTVLSWKNDIKGDVLDVGTGSDPWTRENFGNSCRLTTFDQTKSQTVDVVGDLLNLESCFPNKKFDAVLSLEVFEHTAEPFKAIEEIKKVLKPGGKLIITTPFNLGLHGEEYGDYFRYTRQGWRHLLKDFKEVEVKWLGRETSPVHYAVRATL